MKETVAKPNLFSWASVAKFYLTEYCLNSLGPLGQINWFLFLLPPCVLAPVLEQKVSQVSGLRSQVCSQWFMEDGVKDTDTWCIDNHNLIE